ncbi:MAG: recombinase family protein [Chitinophagaceae bacterium]
MRRGVAYYRVSTERQGESGLGLEAQKEAVHQYIKIKRIQLVKEYVEVESGKKNKRPVLQEALLFCSKNRVILLIAKLDRLARNVAFISKLMESKTEFVAVDNPEANHLILHILAAFAEYEREQISKRTKGALEAAKKRGVKLGKNGKALAIRNKELSQMFCNKLKPVIDELKNEGFTTVQAITDQLNMRQVPTYRPGSKWHKSTVHAALQKIKNYLLDN